MLELAQGNIDWVELVIFLVVIGISAFSAIAKALIKKFTPSDNAKKGTLTVDRRASTPEPLEPRQPPPQTTVARPLPPRPRPVVVARPAVERPEKAKRRETLPIPEPLREILSEVMPDLIPEPAKVPPRPQPVVQTPGPVPPTAQPVTGATEPKPRRARKQSRSSAPPRERVSIADVEQRLSHLETDLVHHASDDVPKIKPGDDPFSLVRRPSRAALRYAMVMKEILGPPLALRTQDNDPI